MQHLGVLGGHDVNLSEKNRLQQKGLSKLQDIDSGFYKGKKHWQIGEDVLAYLEKHSYDAMVLETRCEFAPFW